VWDDSHVVFGEKIPWWKRKNETVHYRDATSCSFVAKVRGEVFAHFIAFIVKRHSSVRNWLFGLPGRILDESILHFVFYLSRRFRFRWVWTFRVRLKLYSPNTCLIIAGIFVAFYFEICTKFSALLLSDPSRRRIRPDTRLQIKWCKTSELRTSCTLIPKTW
jgi:hypothetical protein